MPTILSNLLNHAWYVVRAQQIFVLLTDLSKLTLKYPKLRKLMEPSLLPLPTRSHPFSLHDNNNDFLKFVRPSVTHVT